MPASRQRSRSSSSTCAVVAMIGVRTTLPLRFKFANLRRRFKTIHDRHRKIHHDNSRALFAVMIDRFGAIVGNDDIVARRVHKLGNHHLVDHIVFGHQDLDTIVAVC